MTPAPKDRDERRIAGAFLVTGLLLAAAEYAYAAMIAGVAMTDRKASTAVAICLGVAAICIAGLVGLAACRHRFRGLSRGSRTALACTPWAAAAAPACIALYFGVVRTGHVGSPPPDSVSFSYGDQQLVARRAPQASDTFVVEVVDLASGKVLFTSTKAASEHSSWYLAADQGMVWCYSGDIGMGVYVRAPDGSWSEAEIDPRSALPQEYRMPAAVFQELPESLRRRLELWERRR